MPVAELLGRLASAEDQLQRVMAESERRDRLATLGTISGMIAHEVNNLMTPVLTYAQLALAHPDDASLTRKALEHAASSAQSAARVMSALLALARESPAQPHAVPTPEGGEAPSRSTWNTHLPTPTPALSRDTCNVARAVDAAISCLGHEPGRGGVQIHTDIAADLIAPIAHVALQHVVLNLILNARKAILRSGKRGASITIRAGAASSEPSSEPGVVWSRPWPVNAAPHIIIEVRDTGPGMEREQLLQLFSGPARAQVSALPEAPPTQARSASFGAGSVRAGLGLEVCRRLLEHAGGCLAIASSPGAGTRVWCVLSRVATA